MKTKVANILLGVITLIVLNSFTKNFHDLPETKAAPGYSVGDNAADFKLKNINGQLLSLSDIKDTKGYIVAFTCVQCGVSNQYENRLIALDKKYRHKGFPVVAIDPTDVMTLTSGELQKKVVARRYSFPYLLDETQDVTKKFGATKTPTLYILQKEGDKLVIKYIGSIDDYAEDANSVNYKYAEDAIDAVLKGKPVVKPLIQPEGCDIRFKS